MAPASGFVVDLEGADAALAALGQTAGRLAHPKPMYQAVGQSLVTSTQHRFQTETDPDGNAWPTSIRARLFGGKTLTDSGYLARSITSEATDAGVAVGTNVIYAAIHQLGGIIRAVSASALHFLIAGHDVFVQQVTIPKRAFLGLDAADEKEIVAIAADFLLAPLGGPEGEVSADGGQ